MKKILIYLFLVVLFTMPFLFGYLVKDHLVSIGASSHLTLFSILSGTGMTTIMYVILDIIYPLIIKLLEWLSVLK